MAKYTFSQKWTPSAMNFIAFQEWTKKLNSMESNWKENPFVQMNSCSGVGETKVPNSWETRQVMEIAAIRLGWTISNIPWISTKGIEIAILMLIFKNLCCCFPLPVLPRRIQAPFPLVVLKISCSLAKEASDWSSCWFKWSLLGILNDFFLNHCLEANLTVMNKW